MPKMKSLRIPLTIPDDAWLTDHHFQHRPVLPAVIAMEWLIRSTREQFPHISCHWLTNAVFRRFLYLDTPPSQLVNEIQIDSMGNVTGQLISTLQLGKSGISRTVSYAQVRFPVTAPEITIPPTDRFAALTGICMKIPSRKVYGELVPFGPAWQNIDSHVWVSESGAIAQVNSLPDALKSGPDTQPPGWILGSPFPLDAAFHVACIWCQRFAGIVAFPVGIHTRYLFRPTTGHAKYKAHIFPVRSNDSQWIFDIWILDTEGEPVEAVIGVMMRDVSGGQWTPPNWIHSQVHENPLVALCRSQCEAFCLMELDTLQDHGEKMLSDPETTRYQNFKGNRKKNYLASRFCCKQVSRFLSQHDGHTPSQAITTIEPNGPKPICPRTDDGPAIHCSVSHDRRFAICVASNQKVGIDVEPVLPRVLNIRRKFMQPEEWTLTHRSNLGTVQAALRVWSIKEAVSKALNIAFPKTWKQVQVRTIGDKESFGVVNDIGFTAFHELVDDHLFTLVKFP